MKNDRQKEPLALLGAKVPREVRGVIEQKASDEERSVSQITARLLASHPDVIKALKRYKTAKAEV